MKGILAAAFRHWQLAPGQGDLYLRAVAARHGTPLYLYSGPLLESRVAALRSELPADLALLYAVKANPHPAVLALLAPLVDGFDVTSAAEIELAGRVGAVGEALSFAGPAKTEAELEAALASGALVVLESLEEGRRLAALAAGSRRPPVALRLNPPFSLAADARMGGGAQRFGVDSEAAPAALQELGCLPLDFRGFHVYAGSRCLDAVALARAQRATLELVRELAPFAPGPLRLLNLGGGLGIPCFPGESALNLAAVGDALRALAREAARHLPGVRLTLELGRYLVGEAGLYLARVVERKVSRGRVFLLLDGGAHHHWHATGALEGRRHLHFPIMVLGKGDEAPRERVTVCGPLCAPHDTWAQDILLPAAGPGDLVAVFQSGAYGASASPMAFLGKPPAAEILTEWPQSAAAAHSTREETQHAERD